MPSVTTRTPSRVLVLLTVIVVGFLLLLASAVQANGPADPPARYRVGQGDSLWSVASSHAEAGDDIRALVFEIQQINGLEGSIIHPGQVLLVPAG